MDRSQIRAARALLGWSQEDLAKASGVSLPTIKRIEPGTGPIQSGDDIVSKISKSLLDAGVQFITSDMQSVAGGFGVRLIRGSEESRLSYLLMHLTEAEFALEKAIGACRTNDPTEELEHAAALLDRASEAVAAQIRRLDETEDRHRE